MRKFFEVIVVVMLLCVMTARGEYADWKWNTTDLSGTNSVQKRIDNLDDRLDAIGVTAADGDVVATDDVTATDDLTAGDDLIVTDDATFGGLMTITPTALSVTNGQAITVTERFYVVTGIGGADDTTNVCTLANPVTAGKLVTFVVASDSSNLFGLADSGNLALSSAANLDNNDNITLYGATTGTWVEVGEVNN